MVGNVCFNEPFLEDIAFGMLLLVKKKYLAAGGFSYRSCAKQRADEALLRRL